MCVSLARKLRTAPIGAPSRPTKLLEVEKNSILCKDGKAGCCIVGWELKADDVASGGSKDNRVDSIILACESVSSEVDRSS